MFDTTMGTWNTTPVDLELRGNEEPVWSRPYPVPRVQEAMFRKKAEKLVSLGVLEDENESKEGAPLFSQPKAKTNHVRFLNDFWNLDKKLKLKPYPIPKKCEMLLNLEGF